MLFIPGAHGSRLDSSSDDGLGAKIGIDDGGGTDRFLNLHADALATYLGGPEVARRVVDPRPAIVW